MQDHVGGRLDNLLSAYIAVLIYIILNFVSKVL